MGHVTLITFTVNDMSIMFGGTSLRVILNASLQARWNQVDVFKSNKELSVYQMTDSPENMQVVLCRNKESSSLMSSKMPNRNSAVR